MAKLIEGKVVAQKILENLSDEILFLNKKPSLAVIIVGDDPASKIYVNLKKKKAQELGITSQVIETFRVWEEIKVEPVYFEPVAEAIAVFLLLEEDLLLIFQEAEYEAAETEELVHLEDFPFT